MKFFKALAILCLIPNLLFAKSFDLKPIEDYWNSVNTIEADFIQTSNYGQESGKFYLSKPGKLRWEYSPPSPKLIIINNKLVTYYDQDLDQVSYVKTDDTILDLLSLKDLRFGVSIKLIKAEERNNRYYITVSEKNNIDVGNITLIFKKDPLEFIEFETTDQNGDKLQVMLFNKEYNTPLSKKLFTFEQKAPSYPGSTVRVK